MNFTVVGLGYVGLINALILAVYRHDVIAYDVDREKIELLKQGVAPIEEPNVQECLTQIRQTIRFTDLPDDAFRNREVIVIAVDTPPQNDGAVDLRHFNAVLDAIVRYATKDAFIVIRSTVPVGTNARALKYLNERSSHHFDVISAPEFLSQGRAMSDELNPYRIVLGLRTTKARELAEQLLRGYRERKFPILYTSPENAELIKYAANSFLAMKISYINDIARLCDVVGGNIDDVAAGLALDPRIGPHFLKAGIGYGGSCFPKDTSGLCWLSSDNAVPLPLVKATMAINASQITYFLKMIQQRFKSLNDRRVAVLGLAFKGGTEDVRNSPSLAVIRALNEKGALITAYDPLAIDAFRKAMIRFTKIRYVDYPHEALKDADLAVILNDSEEFKALKAEDFISNMREPIVFDGRNLYPLTAMEGVEYHSIGRPVVKR